MAAAACKLMSNFDLMTVGAKCQVVVRANNTLGLPGRLSSRCQPNHPTDDVEGILASMREGLSYGCGDAVIGVNPATDTPRVDGGDPAPRSTTLLARNARPDAALRAVARHRADEGARARLPDGL